jgi:hypothetical protein
VVPGAHGSQQVTIGAVPEPELTPGDLFAASGLPPASLWWASRISSAPAGRRRSPPSSTSIRRFAMTDVLALALGFVFGLIFGSFAAIVAVALVQDSDWGGDA